MTGENTDFQFTAGAAYENFMGPWSRAAGAVFLDWLAIPEGCVWLDIGCGTGAFTSLLVEKAHPASVVAMDPSPAQIDHARAGVLGPCADFHVADAENLPFEDAFFDVAASALVLNFIPDRARALAEMRRVVRPGGCIAAYVWDFTGPLSVNRHVADVLRAIKADVAPIPGVKSTRMEALHEIFEAAGLADVAGRAIEVERRFADFEAYWRGFLDNPTPASGFIRQLPKAGYEEFREAVRSSLSEAPDGSVTFAARAHAIKAIKPR